MLFIDFHLVSKKFRIYRLHKKILQNYNQIKRES
jgi:hypothetical protein